jgi:hypothetical protein
MILEGMTNGGAVVAFQIDEGGGQGSQISLGRIQGPVSGNVNFALIGDNNPGLFILSDTFAIAWTSGTPGSQPMDTAIIRGSAGMLAITDADQTLDPSLAIQARSTTTNKRDRFHIDTVAVDNTDATRKYRAIFRVYDTAAREAMRIEADGGAARLGFYGRPAVARPNVTGSRGGNAALQSLLTQLVALGLITDGTSA